MARAAAEIERAMLEKAPTLRLGAYRPIKLSSAAIVRFRFRNTTFWRIESYLLTRQTAGGAIEIIREEDCHMKSQRPTQAKNALNLSDAIIAKRYLDLQRLRDEVRKAEISCGVGVLYSKKTARSGLRSKIENRKNEGGLGPA
jgi:hypothetical protein